jgi:hypothetical protein
MANSDEFRDLLRQEGDTPSPASESLPAAGHEAIHAVLHAVLRRPFIRVSIGPDEPRVWTIKPGDDEQAQIARILDVALPNGVELLRSQLRWLIATVGPWACKGITWGPDLDRDHEFGKDVEVASHHACRLLAMDDHGNSVARARQPSPRETEIMQRAESLARRLALRHATGIDRVAAALNQWEQLTEAEVQRLCCP